MAQLPPKVPTMPQDFSNFHHQQRLHSMSNFTQSSTPQQQQSWVDDFLNFSTSKRNAHRRSARDSITFLEAPMVEEENPASSAVLRSRDNEFERLDDEQLMSMFTDDISPKNVTSSSPIPSTSSEHNEEKPTFFDQQPKSEPTEVESSCVLETSEPAPSTTTSDYQAIDPKRVRRILANRQSAQRSRVRKLQYISELERSVNSLQNEVSTLSPRVAFLDHQRLVLNVDNSALKQRLAALAQDNIFKDAHQEALRKEIERLRQVYHEQNLKKMGDTGNDTEVCTENEELVD